MSLCSCLEGVFHLLGLLDATRKKAIHILRARFCAAAGNTQILLTCGQFSLGTAGRTWDDLLMRNLSFFFQSPISFAEVAMYFSSAEWALLDQHQRSLYEAVIMDNYENVTFVGKECPLARNL